MPEVLLMQLAVEPDQPSKEGGDQRPRRDSAGQRHLFQIAEAEHMSRLLQNDHDGPPHREIDREIVTLTPVFVRPPGLRSINPRALLIGGADHGLEIEALRMFRNSLGHCIAVDSDNQRSRCPPDRAMAAPIGSSRPR